MKTKKIVGFILFFAFSVIMLSSGSFALDSYTHDWGYINPPNTYTAHGYLYVYTGGTPNAYAKTTIQGPYPYIETAVEVYNPDGTYDSRYKSEPNKNQSSTPYVYANTAWGPGMAFYGSHSATSNFGGWSGNTWYIY